MFKNSSPIKPLSLGDIDLLISRLQATRSAMTGIIKHQGLMIDETPVKSQEIIEWPTKGLSVGSVFLYRRKNGVRRYTVLTVDRAGKPLTWTRCKI